MIGAFLHTTHCIMFSQMYPYNTGGCRNCQRRERADHGEHRARA